jgi:hypothetical protein
MPLFDMGNGRARWRFDKMLKRWMFIWLTVVVIGVLSLFS